MAGNGLASKSSQSVDVASRTAIYVEKRHPPPNPATIGSGFEKQVSAACTLRRSHRVAPAAFLVAYTCSGVAGLIYEVSWTRLLTLHIGHTTAAASAVVAAFMGGLAIGAAVAGRLAARLTLRQCLYTYALLEVSVAALALVLPVELRATTPVLAWAYRNGEPGLLFPIVRLGVSFVLILVPALALGATFPVAVRWFTARSRWPAARAAGALYAWNTAARRRAPCSRDSC